MGSSPPQGNPHVASSVQKDVTLTDQAQISYNTALEALEIKGINNLLQVGQETYIRVINNTGVTIPDGKAVRLSGHDATNDAVEIVLAKADSSINASVVGLTTTTMANGVKGLVTTFGRVNDINTTAIGTAGQTLFLSATTAGEVTVTAPAIAVPIGIIGKVDPTTGFIQVQLDVAAASSSAASAFAQLSDSTVQRPSVTTPVEVTLDTNDNLVGITHSETVNPADITVAEAGNYILIVAPQVGRTSGTADRFVDFWLRKNDVDTPNSNVRTVLTKTGAKDVIVLQYIDTFAASDKINIMMSIEVTGEGLGIETIQPSGEPRIPAIIFSMHRL